MSTKNLQNSEESFSERFRTARLRRGLTQEELARMLEVSNGAVGMWEIGPSVPRAETIQKIAVLLDTSIDFLINGNESSSRIALHEPSRGYHVDEMEELLSALDEHDRASKQLRSAAEKIKRKSVSSRPVSEKRDRPRSVVEALKRDAEHRAKWEGQNHHEQ